MFIFLMFDLCFMLRLMDTVCSGRKPSRACGKHLTIRRLRANLPEYTQKGECMMLIK